LLLLLLQVKTKLKLAGIADIYFSAVGTQLGSCCAHWPMHEPVAKGSYSCNSQLCDKLQCVGQRTAPGFVPY
jgi:hypothetical protein